MKKKLSVLFLLSFITAGGFVLYKTRSPVEKLTPDLARETVSVAPSQTAVKKAKKEVKAAPRKNTPVTD